MKQTLLSRLARAEAVIADAEKRTLHKPTVDIFKGQAMAYREALSLLEIEESRPVVRMDVNRTFTLTVPWASLAILSLTAVGGMIYLLYYARSN